MGFVVLKVRVWQLLPLLCIAALSVIRAEETNSLYNYIVPAMYGYDPIMSNPLGTIDPGSCDPIFEPIGRDDDNIPFLLPFLGKVHEHLSCDSGLTMKTFRNYEEYENDKYSVYSFSEGASTSTNGKETFSFETSSGYGNKNMQVHRFLKEENATIIQVKFKCISHEVSISPFKRPNFTSAFVDALLELHIASQDPESSQSKNIFHNFVKAYGTHYKRRTFLGYSLVFEKRFPCEEPDQEKILSQRKCVADAAFDLIRNLNGPLSPVSASFSNTAAKCDSSLNSETYFLENNMKSELIIANGQLPTSSSSESWFSATKRLPVPLTWELAKISSLFRSDWFDGMGLNYNETLMYMFMEHMSADYLKRFIEDKEQPETTSAPPYPTSGTEGEEEETRTKSQTNCVEDQTENVKIESTTYRRVMETCASSVISQHSMDSCHTCGLLCTLHHECTSYCYSKADSSCTLHGVAATIDMGPGTITHDSRNYLFVARRMNYADALANCLAKNASLALPMNLEQEQQILAVAVAGGWSGWGAWLSVSDEAGEGTWHSSGPVDEGGERTLLYTNWHSRSGEPDGGDRANCAVVDTDGWWDVSCATKTDSVCQVSRTCTALPDTHFPDLRCYTTIETYFSPLF